MNNTLTLQPKRPGHYSHVHSSNSKNFSLLKRSQTHSATISTSSSSSSKKTIFNTRHHQRGVSISAKIGMDSIMSILCDDDDDDEGDDEDEDDDYMHLNSPSQKRNVLKRHNSMLTFSSSRMNSISKFERKLQITEERADEEDKENVFGTKNSVQRSVQRELFFSHHQEEHDYYTKTNCVLDQTGFEYVKERTDNDIPIITLDTFHNILKSFKEQKGHFGCSGDNKGALFTDLSIVDCRFPFEYQGGHIEGAINVTSINQLEELFFNNIGDSPKDFTNHRRKLIIFHCEFSSMRGPLRATQLRNLDRKYSGNENYPNLFYPDVVILKGGYKSYFDSIDGDLGYIEMDHPEYEREREHGLSLLRAESRSSLGR